MKRIVVGCLIFALIMTASMVWGGVTVTREMSMEIPGMPPMKMISTEQIQGDKNSVETQLDGGGMMGMPKGEKQTTDVNITRLDKGVFWVVNVPSQSYREMAMTDLAQIEDQSPNAVGKDESDEYDWKLDIKKNEKADINGFACTGVVATATGTSKKNPESQAVITYEYWAAEDVPGQDEINSFQDKFMEVSGVDPTGRERMTKKLGYQFGAQFEKLLDASREIKGYPIKTVINAKLVGEAPDGESADDRAKAMAMMKKMMGDQAGGEEEEGVTTLFSVTTTVTGVESGDVDAGTFEIPEGFIKK